MKTREEKLKERFAKDVRDAVCIVAAERVEWNSTEATILKKRDWDIAKGVASHIYRHYYVRAKRK